MFENYEKKKTIKDISRTAYRNVVIYLVSMSLFCLSHTFVYLLYFPPNWDRVKYRTEIKIKNKQGHGNWAIVSVSLNEK